MNKTILRLLAVGLLVTGLIGIIWKQWPTQVESSYHIERLDQAIERKVPVSLSFPRLGMDFTVIPGVISGSTWQVDTTRVNYLVGSGVIGDPGNVVLYAHKRAGMFADLKKLRVGDEIQVWSDDVLGIYQVAETMRVTPANVDILNATDDATLTLFTCDGPTDAWRWVVKARLVGRMPEAEEDVDVETILPTV